jgi:hypothetical protein
MTKTCNMLFGGTEASHFADALVCQQATLAYCEHKDCQEPRCADHLRVCRECGGVYCYDPTSACCMTDHPCAGSLAAQITATYKAA